MMAYQHERILMGDGAELESWNPQRDDYQDPRFNSYDRGPGRNLVGRQQASGRGVTLYVQNLPNGITDEGLRNIFLYCGHVLSTSVKISRKGNSECMYGFVDMATIREAESAIAELNGYLIGNARLKVEIALSKEEKDRRAQQKEEEDKFLQSLNIGRTGSSMSDTEGRSQKVMQNGHGGKTGRGRAERLEELTDTEMVEPRPGRLPNPRAQTGPARRPVPGNQSDVGYAGSNVSMNQYPVDRPSGGYFGGYGRNLDQIENLLMGRDHEFNHYRPDTNYAGGGMNRGINRGMYPGNPNLGPNFGGNQWQYARGGGFMRGRGRGFDNFAYGRGSPFGGFGDNFCPRGRGFMHPRGMGPGRPYGIGRGFNQTFTAPELFHDRSGYFTDTERFRPRTDQPAKKPAKRQLPPKPCLNCSEEGILRCSRCKMPYCSHKCQVTHWEKHKKVCKELSEMGNANLDELEERFDVAVDNDFLENCSKIAGKKGSPQKMNDTSSESSKYSDEGRGTRGGRGKSGRGRGNQINGYAPKKKPDEKPKTQISPGERKPSGGSQKKSPPQQQQGPMMGRRPYQQNDARPGMKQVTGQPMHNKFQFKKMQTVTLPLNMPVQVVIAHVESPSKIWVQPAIYEQLSKLEDLMLQVNKVCNLSSENVTLPIIGGVYAAKFEGDNKWYRVEVTALQAPDTACVFYFDFGNTASVTYAHLRPLTREMIEHPIQAVQCSLSDVCPLGKDWGSDCLSLLKTLLPEMDVRVFQAKDRDQKGCYSGQFFLPEEGPSIKDVLIQEKKAKSSLSRLMVANIPVTAEVLKIGQEFLLYIVHCESPGNISAQIIEDSRVDNFRQMMIDLGKSQLDSKPLEHIPEIGEFVIAKFSYDGDWYRAEILEVADSKVKVSYIDYGNSEQLDKQNIRIGLNRFTSLPVQCVTCFLHGITSPDVLNWPVEVTNSFKKMVTGQTLKAVVKSKIGNSLGVELFSPENKPLSVVITEELNTLELKSSASMKGRPDSESLPLDGASVDVAIYEVVSCHCFYVQKLEIADQSAVYQMLVALNAIEATPPYDKPSKGERVAAKFSEDGTWYRALVKEVTSSGCDVHFIDYGNGETVPLENVRKLDKTSASLPGRAIQCRLSGAPKDSQQHQNLLNMYKNTQVQVQALTETAGVYEVKIILQGGQCLNEITIPLAASTDRQPAAAVSPGEARVFTLEDMGQSAPLSGKMQVLVKSVEDPSSFCCLIMEDDVKQVAEILERNMALYYKGETTPANDPKVNQLFCVQFEDTWCRCVVLERKSVAVRIHLLDYGTVEEVAVTDLRPMKPEFIELRELAIKCALHGIGPTGDKWSENAIEAVKRIEGQVLLMIPRTKKGDRYEVQLCDPSNESIDVGAILVNQELATSVSKSPAPSPDPPVLPARVKKVTLPCDGTEVEAVIGHIQEFDQIYIQLVPGAIDAINLVREMTEACNTQGETLMPGRGEMVCALFEGDWYRARVDGVKENNCRVFFVDYGNFDNVPFSSIKRLNAKFSELPMQGIHCSLAEVSIRNDKEQLQKLKSLLTEKLLVKVIEVKNEIFIVQIRVGQMIVNDQFKPGAGPVTQNDAAQSACPAQTAAQRSVESLMCATLPTDGTSVTAVAADIQGFSSVYLQTMQGFEEVNELMGKINTTCCDTANPSITPKLGDLVSACFSVDNVWYRASVVERSSDLCTVVFIDYGNSDKLPFSMIKKLDVDFLALPSQAIRCSLEGAMETNNPEKLAHLQEMITGKPLSVKALGKVDDIYSVEIKVNDENVNDIFRSAHVEPKKSKKLQSLTYAVLPDGSTVDAVVAYIESFDVIYIQTIEGLETLCDMMAEMNSQCADDPATVTPVVGDFVSVFYTPDDAWYRARVDKVREADCKVYLVDYGNSASVPLSLIKQLNTQFRSFPCQGIHCSLDGTHLKNDPEKLEQLKQMITNVKLSVHVVSKKDDVFAVSIWVNDGNVNDLFRNSPKTGASDPGATNTAAVLKIGELPMNTPVEAVATHIEDFDALVVQTLDGGRGLCPVMEKLNQHCTSIGDSSITPRVGDVVCAWFSQDNTWYRARVDEVTMDTKTCKVFFLDYGNSDSVPFKGVMKIPEEFLAYPVQGIRCSLANVSTRKDVEKLAKLNECIGNILLTIKAVSRQGPLSVVEISVGENLINDIFKDTSSEALEVPRAAELPADGTTVDAIGMHIQDFDCIYVQTFEGYTSLIELMKEINVYCTNSSTSLTPCVGGLVCALFTQDNEWYRARVDKITSEGISVFFVDYGNTDLVAPVNIKKLESQFRSLPVQGIRCALNNVSIRNDSEKLSVLSEKINGRKLTLKVVGKEADIYSVEMLVENESINELFSPVVRAPPTVEIPTDGSSVDAVATDIQDFDTIYVQTVEGGTALITLMNELNVICSTQTASVVPSIGDLVSAWYEQDSTWYRARVDEITQTRCKVFFVDYGNSDMVELSKIRKLDAKFSSFPLQAVRCCLTGVDIRNDAEQLQKLGENIADQKLTIRASSVKDGIYQVEMAVDDRKKSLNALFRAPSPVDDEAEAIRKQIEELQLKLAAKTKKK